MADVKVTALVEDTAPSMDDLLMMVNDPGGVPASRKLAISNLVKVMGYINVKTYATGDGVTDDGAAITSAIADVPAGGTLFFPPGTYAYAASPNFAVTKMQIIGSGAILKHTGASGAAFSLDGGAAGGGVLGMKISDLLIQGGAGSDYGIYARALHHSIFNNLRITGAAAAGVGLQLNWCVANQWNNFRCTTVEAHEATMPTYGIFCDRRGVGENTTTQTFINLVIEGLAGNGIHIDYASHNTFIGGTSESNDKGIYITNNGYGGNNLVGTDFEANVTYDLHILGPYTNFLGIYSTEASLIAGHYNSFVGGTLDTVTISGDHNFLSNLLIVTSFTNSSSYTRISNVDGPTGIPIPNTISGIDAVTKRVTHANAAPVAGTWAVGDICYNQSPSAANPAGWMCSVAGTPGTWVAMANLA